MIVASTRFAAALAALLFALLATAADQGAYQPRVGQPGKDVIWVPTPDDLVERMLTMAQVTAKDYVVDLGSGDGRVAIAAAKRFGARALGIEYNPDMVALSQKNAQAAGVSDRVSFRQADIFATDFTQADVVTMYLLPELNMKLRPRLLSMRPGTRIVSHAFYMEDWEPDEMSNANGNRAYFWVVPANVMGEWSLAVTGAGRGERYEVEFFQQFQRIRGQISMDRNYIGLRDARLRGAQIEFAFVDANGIRRDFAGTVSGRQMQGTFRGERGSQGRWTATKM